nr:EOG090X076T [Sida crystallina]
MEKSLRVLLDHCIKHQFISPSLKRFGLLGNLVQWNVKNEWFGKNVIVNNKNTLVLEGLFNLKPVSTNLIQQLQNAHSLFGGKSSISFATCSSEPLEDVEHITNDENNNKDEISVANILKCMPRSYLNLHTFSPPGHQIDDFSNLQKKRRLWWKSMMRQPEMLRIEVGSTALEGCTMEAITLWKPELFDDPKLNEEMKIVSNEKSDWPCLITTQMRLEAATWNYLIDSFTSQSMLSSLQLHHVLSPFKVVLMIENNPTHINELQELSQLLTQQLIQQKISVLPSSAQWSIQDCDARAVPFNLLLDETTLENGICSLRSRDTNIQVQVHVSEVIDKLKSVWKNWS